LYANVEIGSVPKGTVANAAAAQNLIVTQRAPAPLKRLNHAEAAMNNENKTTTRNPKYQNPKNQPYSKQPLAQDDPRNQERANPPHDPAHDTIQNKSSERHDSARKPQGETQTSDKTKTATGETKVVFCRNEGPRPIRATRGFNILERQPSTNIPGLALVLPETNTEAANLVARRICESVAHDGKGPTLSIRVGAAVYSHDAETIESLLSAADAMYAMKHERASAAHSKQATAGDRSR
jgi:hypothetical protein